MRMAVATYVLGDFRPESPPRISTTPGDANCAGGGKDRVNGKGDNDRLFGEGGNDKLNGGAGKKDRCVGGPGKAKALK
jgi:hypothetical protein